MCRDAPVSVLKLAAALDWSHSLRAGEEVKALAWPADSTRAAAAEVDAVEDASEGADGAEDAPDALAPPFFFLPPLPASFSFSSLLSSGFLASAEDCALSDYWRDRIANAVLLPALLSCLARNLVTSLIQHEQIKTTFPKAQDAARLAEKVHPRAARTP